jgi:hypothetical protein
VVPASATGAEAAHQKGFQDDGLLLAFVLPTGEVGVFIPQLASERPLRTREQPIAGAVKPTTPFAHLGLPEPESVADVREGQVCAPCRWDLNSPHVSVARVEEDVRQRASRHRRTPSVELTRELRASTALSARLDS